jgi:hypothetical protein
VPRKLGQLLALLQTLGIEDPEQVNVWQKISNRAKSTRLRNTGTAPDPTRITSRPQFAQALNQAFRGSDLTVRELAQQAGIPLATISDYLNGKHLPPKTKAHRLLDLLNAVGITKPKETAAWTAALNRARVSPSRGNLKLTKPSITH